MCGNSRGERLNKDALKQMADWARAWVENETAIPETPDERLSDQEKGALMLMNLIESLP